MPDLPSSGPPPEHPIAPPAGPSARPPDLIGVALGSLVAGATAGAATVAVGLAALRDRLENLLPLLLFVGIAVAAAGAWTRAAAIVDWWRRGLTAALAVFGAMMLTALTAPVDMLGGRAALAVFALALVAASVLATGYARRRGTRGG